MPAKFRDLHFGNGGFAPEAALGGLEIQLRFIPGTGLNSAIAAFSQCAISS
jgi:hypothetical protein